MIKTFNGKKPNITFINGWKAKLPYNVLFSNGHIEGDATLGEY